jgi:hypothetical protein
VSSSGSDEEEGSLSAYSWPVYGGCHPKPLPEVHAIVRATMARTVRERGNAQGKDAREETITSDNENERQLRRVEHHPDAPMTEVNTPNYPLIPSSILQPQPQPGSLNHFLI